MSKSAITIFLLLGISSIALADQHPEKPFAIVELFSSEGCSACPGADVLLGILSDWARKNNEAVFPLDFHVDYWNHLGWADVYSREEYTQRQKNYAEALNGQGLYTPQMIVNGRDAFVGTDQGRLQQDLNNELTSSVHVHLNIGVVKKEGQILVNYKSNGFSLGDVINIALVERDLSSQVTAGENAGQTLHHSNVVREFQTETLTQADAQASIPINKDIDINKSSVIVYVQNPQTMIIEDAQQVDLGHG